MVALLSEDWCAALVAATAGLEPVPGATAVVQHVVNGAPEGTLLFHLRYEDGRVAAAGVGKAPGAPDLTFTTTYGDAQRVASGELDLSAAYMQGTLKAEGDMRTLFALLPATHRPAFREAVAGVAAGG